MQIEVFVAKSGGFLLWCADSARCSSASSGGRASLGGRESAGAHRRVSAVELSSAQADFASDREAKRSVSDTLSASANRSAKSTDGLPRAFSILLISVWSTATDAANVAWDRPSALRRSRTFSPSISSAVEVRTGNLAEKGFGCFFLFFATETDHPFRFARQTYPSTRSDVERWSTNRLWASRCGDVSSRPRYPNARPPGESDLSATAGIGDRKTLYKANGIAFYRSWATMQTACSRVYRRNRRRF